MENTTEKYKVLATPKDSSKPYYIHNGLEMFLENAISECNDCNKFWGDRIVYTIVKINEDENEN